MNLQRDAMLVWNVDGEVAEAPHNSRFCSMIRLTHWGRVTHICVGNLTIIGSDNGLSPDRRQAIIWNNAGISLIGPLWTNFSEIVIKIHTFSFKKMHLKMLSGKWQPSCLGINVLNQNIHPVTCICIVIKTYRYKENRISLSLEVAFWHV